MGEFQVEVELRNDGQKGDEQQSELRFGGVFHDEKNWFRLVLVGLFLGY